jgi:nicotinate-nucleotide pyrophosphorylase
LPDTRNSRGKFEKHLLERIVRLALDEDLVDRDVTTLSLNAYDRPVKAEIIAKQDGLISGIEPLKETFSQVDVDLEVEVIRGDGSKVKPGEVIVRVRGMEGAILRAERTALNFIQRLSGIATATGEYMKQISDSKIRLLDTRKTTPGMRYLEKKAVRDGGGTNHRLNLEELAMVKDNHILMAGSITRAVEAIRRRYPRKKIEVEVKNIKELREALELDVDMAMLDNFEAHEIRQAVEVNQNRLKLEVSGNISLDNIRDKAVPGVDFVSVGALTHSFKSLDMSLEIVSGLSSDTE